VQEPGNSYHFRFLGSWHIFG